MFGIRNSGLSSSSRPYTQSIGRGLYFYWRGRVGPRFWTIVGGIGVAFGWLGHFSPFTDQPPQHILNAYTSVAAGWLALICLIALMLALIAAEIYAGRLWVLQRNAAR
jgi:hypothetical protein